MVILKRFVKKYKWTALGCLLTGIMLVPIYFIAIYGFMTEEEMFHLPPYLFPPNPTLDSFRMTLVELLPYMKNSFIIASGCLVITLIVVPLAAYPLAHFKLRSAKYIFFLLLLSQMFPIAMIAVPLFLIYNRIGLLNNYSGIILATTIRTIPLCILILTAYIRSIPFELVESAAIDGASIFTAFRKVILPLIAPGMATIAIFAFLLAWGEFVLAVTMLNKEAFQPTTVGLYNYLFYYELNWPALMAGAFIFAVPALIVVTVTGRFIVAGLTAGALKE